MNAPTSAARWFNKLDTDYHVSSISRVQTFDVADLNDDSLYQWWQEKTSPRHPLLADPSSQLMKQLQAGDSWPEVLVVDCYGKVTYHKEDSMDQQMYDEVKKAIDSTIETTYCPL